MSVLILAMIQDQASVASKHYLVETEDKSSVDPPCTPVDKNVATAIYKKKVVVAIILSPGLSTTTTST